MTTIMDVRAGATLNKTTGTTTLVCPDCGKAIAQIHLHIQTTEDVWDVVMKHMEVAHGGWDKELYRRIMAERNEHIDLYMATIRRS